jgi:hypothetical protein
VSRELLDRRVLGAVRFVDAVSGLVIQDQLDVRARGVRWVRNRRGDYVIAEAPGLERHRDTFAVPPATPAVGAVRISITVRDPAGHYLARRATVPLPRDPDSNRAPNRDSLFRSESIPLFPAPAAPTWPGWAVVRASVAGSAPGTVLAGALLRVVRQSDGETLGGGMTDSRGEALVAVQGIPSTTFDDGAGPVVATEVAVRLEVVWDPAAAEPPDPGDLEARRDELLVRSATAMLASGRVVAIAL